MLYSDELRGKIQTRRCARQILSFDGMKYGSISPTDIDGMIEYKNMAYIILEFKHRSSEMPGGQRLALQRMIDDFAKAGKIATLLLCEHDVDDVNEDIIAKDARVRQAYFSGAWFPTGGGSYQGKTVGEAVERFLAYAEKQARS